MKEAVLQKNFGLGNKLPEEDVGYVMDEKFKGKLSDRAQMVLKETGTMARRKGKEVKKHDAITNKNAAKQKGGKIVPLSGDDSLDDNSNDNSLDNSYESKMDENLRASIKKQFGKDAPYAMAAGLAPGLVSKGGRAGRSTFDGAIHSNRKLSNATAFSPHPQNQLMGNIPLPASVRHALSTNMQEGTTAARRSSVAVGSSKRNSISMKRRTFDGNY